jgi:hypothetical protein
VTGKKELAVYATAPIRKGEELLGECRGGLAPLTLSEEAEMSGLDSEMVRAAAAARDASATDGLNPILDGATSASVQALPVGRAMRDFSTVRSTRLKGNVIFLGPARFVNVGPARSIQLFCSTWLDNRIFLQHDCDPNVDLKAVDSGKYISFAALRDIELGQELTTY